MPLSFFDEVYYWATHNGAELDLLLVKNGRLLGVECKCMDASRLTPSMTTALKDLGLERIAVIYPGKKRYSLRSDVHAVPLETPAAGDLMRIWDIEPRRLCRNHLLGEHRELHCIWVVLTQGKKGYSRHPETLRWRGRLKALYRRHTALTAEMAQRGYNHKSPLDKRLATGRAMQDIFIDPPRRQLKLLAAKKCACRTGKRS